MLKQIEVTNGYYIYDGIIDNKSIYFKDEDGNEGAAEFYYQDGCTNIVANKAFRKIAKGKVTIIIPE